ncbi:alpha/beta hydrolase [Arsenicibacter rosenii]|uniref:Alpha/beta hydrolase n=2 Tax=Arsenicibacter rosenii TaxID=1750698 RepID=A0A1S2VS19_9BACT|nr:alpha/beta hydrolase [Arsenicibacter rosenii]
MTEREIREHYAGRPLKPTFYTIDTDTSRLFVAATGADTLPPLLLIHGAPGAWYGYIRMLDDTLLSKQYHVISVDRPGYHKSRISGPWRKRRKQYTLGWQANTIAQALRLNHSGKPATVLGRSYGAPVAARLAADYPAQISQLFLVSPAIDPDAEKFYWFSTWGKFPLIQAFLPKFLNIATHEKFTHADELRKLLPSWSQIQAPVTVMQGGRDWIINACNFDFAKCVLDGKPANFIFLPEAGHLITNSHAELVRSLLLTPSAGTAAPTSAN